MDNEPEITKLDNRTIKETVTVPQEMVYTLDELLNQVEYATNRKLTAEQDIATWQAKVDAARALGVKTAAEIAVASQQNIPTQQSNPTPGN